MRIFLILLILFPCVAYGQITKPGVEGSNGGSLLGRALTVNCDNVCIVCSLSGTILSISLASGCSGGGSSDLLLESGQYLLLEDGTKMIL